MKFLGLSFLQQTKFSVNLVDHDPSATAPAKSSSVKNLMEKMHTRWGINGMGCCNIFFCFKRTLVFNCIQLYIYIYQLQYKYMTYYDMLWDPCFGHAWMFESCLKLVIPEVFQRLIIWSKTEPASCGAAGRVERRETSGYAHQAVHHCHRFQEVCLRLPIISIVMFRATEVLRNKATHSLIHDTWENNINRQGLEGPEWHNIIRVSYHPFATGKPHFTSEWASNMFKNRPENEPLSCWTSSSHRWHTALFRDSSLALTFESAIL